MSAQPIAAALLLASLLPAPARGDERFDALRRHAEQVESLPAFLERYIGSCNDALARQSCEQNVRATRKSFAGKVLVARVDDGVAPLLRAECGRDRWRIRLTPFIDGNGYALTHGAPVGRDGAGRPRIGFLVLEGELPPGVGEIEFQGPFRTGNVEVEVVFRPEGTWKLKRRDRGYYEGVKARFLGLRLVDLRTGAEIASQVLSGG